jgi:hypothetical protein
MLTWPAPTPDLCCSRAHVPIDSNSKPIAAVMTWGQLFSKCIYPAKYLANQNQLQRRRVTRCGKPRLGRPPPPQWGERISAGNSAAAAESVNTNADSRMTRPAGTDASPTHNFRSAAALSAPVTSHKRCRAASSTRKVSVILTTPL